MSSSSTRSAGSSNSGLDGLLLDALLLDAGSTGPSNSGLSGLLLDTLDAIPVALDGGLLTAGLDDGRGGRRSERGAPSERSSPTSEFGSGGPLPSKGGKHGSLVLLRQAF